MSKYPSGKECGMFRSQYLNGPETCEVLSVKEQYHARRNPKSRMWFVHHQVQKQCTLEQLMAIVESPVIIPLPIW